MARTGKNNPRREGARFKGFVTAQSGATFDDFVRGHNARREHAQMTQSVATIGRDGGSLECSCTNPFCQV